MNVTSVTIDMDIMGLVAKARMAKTWMREAETARQRAEEALHQADAALQAARDQFREVQKALLTAADANYDFIPW